MAITRKPKTTAGSGAVVDINALIQKGGSIAGEGDRERSEKPTPVVLRVPPDILAKVDVSVNKRAVRTPRHTWIMEAIVEKLHREEGN